MGNECFLTSNLTDGLSEVFVDVVSCVSPIAKKTAHSQLELQQDFERVSFVVCMEDRLHAENGVGKLHNLKEPLANVDRDIAH